MFSYLYYHFLQIESMFSQKFIFENVLYVPIWKTLVFTLIFTVILYNVEHIITIIM